MPIYGSYKLPLCSAYIRGHYLVILDYIQLVNTIDHVPKAVDEVEEDPQKIIERNSLIKVDVIGVICSPKTSFHCRVNISEYISISYTEVSKSLV